MYRSRVILRGVVMAVSLLGLYGNSLGFAHERNEFTQSSDWRLAKYTLNVHSGTGGDIQAFIGEHLCRSKTVCASDLGCGNFRSWCYVSMPFTSLEFGGHLGELHFVDAPTLNDVEEVGGGPGMDYWVLYFEDLNDDFSTFNAFMHNKLQLYTEDLGEIAPHFLSENPPTNSLQPSS